MNALEIGSGRVEPTRFGAGCEQEPIPAEPSFIVQDFDRFRRRQVSFHALRTRQAGRRSFASFHLLVPGEWSVQQSHDLAEEIEAVLRSEVPGFIVFTHLEPLEDPVSHIDRELDRPV